MVLQRKKQIFTTDMHHNLEISTFTPYNSKWASPYLLYQYA